MSGKDRIVDHWDKGDVYTSIVSALEKMSKPLESLTVKDLAPVDHFHACGFTATVELGDRLPIEADQHILDIGCGLGGPARYFAQRFQCKVRGIDITPSFVEAANKLTHLLNMEDRVTIEQGDAHRLPYEDNFFDGAYTQHVTMSVADRPRFFAQAYRVLKPGAFFALTEHGLGPTGNPYYPTPWSEDGSGAYLISPLDTQMLLERAGFENIFIEDTGAPYLVGYKKMLDKAAKRDLSPLGIHILMGKNTPLKVQNAACNIQEGRTQPVQVFCRKPA